MRDKLYLKDFPIYQMSTERQKKYIKNDGACFNLELIPSLRMRCEIAGFISYRSKQCGLCTMTRERGWVERIGMFLSKQKDVVSFRDKSREIWLKELKNWMIDNGFSLTYHIKDQLGHEYQVKAKMLSYFEHFLKYLEPEDCRPEYEKDIWELKKIDIPYRINPIRNFQTVNFTKITQDGIREELKRAIYFLIQHEALGSINGRMSAMRGFSKYLKEKYSEINSCKEIDRMIIEEYLVYINTEHATVKKYTTELNNLKTVISE